MTKFFACLSACLILYSTGSLLAQIPIADARAMPLGTTVTIRGVVTNGPELGTIRYIQDATGAIPAFPGSGSVPGFAPNVQRGDSVLVTGVLFDFNGLLELSPVTGYTILGKGVSDPSPLPVALHQVGKNLEALLVSISGVQFVNQGFFQANQVYSIENDLGETRPVFIRSGHPLVGTPIPTDVIDLVAIVSWFNGLQLLPRDAEDLISVSGLFFTNFVRQTDLSSSSIQLSWATNLPAGARVLYTSPDGQTSTDTVLAYHYEHVHEIEGLDAATFYEVQVVAERSYSTSNSNQRLMSTAASWPGEVQVFFNYSADSSFSTGPLPLTSSGDEMMDALLLWIAEAEATIDVSIYNINASFIVDALSQAHAKGVRVRLIASEQTANSALDPPPPFPVLYGTKHGLMHNKFVVIDADIPNRAMVYTGAMNFTTQQIYTHYNNMVLVRDQPLAMAYTIEFEEMWGGDGALPDPMLARFGTHKLDNTPKLFKPAGELVELYFSPSDNTNAAILGTLEEAQQDVLFALLTFTRGDLAASVAEGHQQGIDVRGIINNVNDNGSQYNFLLSQGVPVKHHSPSRIFHHKYAVVDQHKVITGSHNWSNAANNINDENTLIFHSPDIANIFRQEFEARWAELPDLTQVSTTWPTSLHIHALVQHDGMIQVLVESDKDRNTVWQLHDMQGRAFATLTQGLQSGQQWLQIPVYFASPGMFVLTARGEDGIFAVSRLSIVR